MHGLFDKAGQPRQRYAYIGLPRKNGKSTLGAALAIYALVCLGPAAHVYSCAGDKKQASIVFDEAKRMVRAEPELSGIIRVQRWHLEGPDDSIYRVLSADAELQQGLNPSFVIFDEVHVQPNRDLWDAMRFGMGARPNPMMIGITTAGFDRTTLAWELYDQGSNGQFFWWREPADRNCDWQDRAAWAEANPALGDFLYEKALVEDMEGDALHESGFRRYHLNQWTTTHSAWLPHGAWDALVRPRVVDPLEPVVLFLDGSWANDSTGIVGCALDDFYLWKVGLWRPDSGLGHVDMAAIEKGLRDALAAYNVVETDFDPRGFQDFFARFEAEGIAVQGWPTNALERMVPACEEFYRAVMDKRIHHDGDPDLAAHIANAVLKEDRYGPRIIKESKTSPRKIDLAVCAVGAYDVARRHAAIPASVYDTRGFLVLGQETP
jgi:phage terminase large subunit-like protein